ncbi:MAG TPA: flagellar basal-body MS-ring/collar protein FliF [Alphaproteobacteria bacterium]|nr:flagellar M-ring protein FliF [Alphaproteobacteria bacterium]HOO49812.1 flagellar basal-body MS-ring/collar protein FliF [Alphaproteobacteria bacterium]
MNNFLETLKKLGPARLSIMGAVLIGLLIFFVYISMQVSAPRMKMLYKELSAEDSAAISTKLEEANISYEISADGETIKVSEKDIGRARVMISQAGLANGASLGYELFDKQSSFGTTSFVQNINQVRALEGELGRTISALEPVRSARVHLVLPQRELFQRESRPASASVFLKLRGGGNLDRDQVQGIQSLIASAVPGLKTKNVSIVDSEGVLLAGGDQDDSTLLSNKAQDAKNKYEQHMTRVIEDLVGRTVGYGNVRANVVAELNFDRLSENQEIYDPDGQVIRSTQTIADNSSETDAGSSSVSVENNVPGGNADLLNGGGPTASAARTEETTNFEISKTVRSIVRETGEVRKLSVGVLIDGTYETDAEGNKTYKPRTEQEVQALTTLISSAIGYDETRGDKLEVVNMQFADVSTEPEDLEGKILGFDRSEILDFAEVLTVVVMVILVVLLVLQPMVGRLLAADEMSDPQGAQDPSMDSAGLLGSSVGGNPALMPPGMGGGTLGALSGPGGMANPNGADEFLLSQAGDDDAMIDVQKVEGRVKASTLKKVEDIISAYPEETVSVLRSWMAQENN